MHCIITFGPAPQRLDRVARGAEGVEGPSGLCIAHARDG